MKASLLLYRVPVLSFVETALLSSFRAPSLGPGIFCETGSWSPPSLSLEFLTALGIGTGEGSLQLLVTAASRCHYVQKSKKEHPCEVRYELLIYVLTILAIYMML